MWKTLIILCLVLACCDAKKKKKRCYAPSYGSIRRSANNTIAYECDDGFELLGPRETVCDEDARRKNRVAACSPIYVGEINCTALDVCPTDVNYLNKFRITEISDEMRSNAKTLLDVYKSSLTARSSGAKFAMCKQACTFGINTCLVYRHRRKFRMYKKCMRCFVPATKCGNQFWG